MKPSNKLLLLYLLLFSMLLCNPAGIFAQSDGASLADAARGAKEAGIPDSTLNRLLITGSDKQRIEPADLAKMLNLLSEAKRNDIPLDPFVSKIEEGMAKKVPAPAIEQVLRKKMEDYRFTIALTADYAKRQGLRQKVTSEDLVGITESLNSGLSRQDLSRISEQAPAASLSSLNRAANVMASLKQIGFDPKLSDRIISTGLKNNFFTPQQRDFARAIAAGKRKGIPDSRIAEAALSTMENKGSIADFRSRIGVTDAEMGHDGPKVGTTDYRMDGVGPSSGMGGSGMGGQSGGGSSGMGGGGMGGGTGGGGSGGGGGMGGGSGGGGMGGGMGGMGRGGGRGR